MFYPIQRYDIKGKRHLESDKKYYLSDLSFRFSEIWTKIYIQVSDDISREETFQREVKPLLSIKDAYPKLLIARTKHEESQYEGIKIIDIARWLSGSQM